MAPTGCSNTATKTHFRCGCGWIGTSPDERAVHEALDSMYGRRPTLETFVEFSCPECGDLVEETVPCLRCHAAEPADGCDHCPLCLAIIDREDDEAVKRSRQVASRELKDVFLDIALAPWRERV